MEGSMTAKQGTNLQGVFLGVIPNIETIYKPEQALEIQANPRNAKFNAIAKDAIFSLNTDDVSPGGGTK